MNNNVVKRLIDNRRYDELEQIMSNLSLRDLESVCSTTADLKKFCKEYKIVDKVYLKSLLNTHLTGDMLNGLNSSELKSLYDAVIGKIRHPHGHNYMFKISKNLQIKILKIIYKNYSVKFVIGDNNMRSKTEDIINISDNSPLIMEYALTGFNVFDKTEYFSTLNINTLTPSVKNEILHNSTTLRHIKMVSDVQINKYISDNSNSLLGVGPKITDIYNKVRVINLLREVGSRGSTVTVTSKAIVEVKKNGIKLSIYIFEINDRPQYYYNAEDDTYDDRTDSEYDSEDYDSESD